jgi:hypothetical protein
MILAQIREGIELDARHGMVWILDGKQRSL